MAGIGTIETAGAYERALRRAARIPASIRAVPDTAAPTLAYAAAMGREEARAKATAADVAYEEKRRAVNERQFQARLASDRSMLEAWGEQNKWATAIALANVGLEGAMMPVRIREAEKQERSLAEIASAYRKNAEALTAGTKAIVEKTAPEYQRTIFDNPERTFEEPDRDLLEQYAKEGQSVPEDIWIRQARERKRRGL